MLVLTRNVLTPETLKKTVVLRDRATGRILAVVGLTKVWGKRGKIAIQAGSEIEVLRGELLEGSEGEICLTNPGSTKPPTHDVLKVRGHRTKKIA